MIRPFQPGDLPQVLDIWLQGNLDAHSFISPDYWRSNLPLAARQIPLASVWVFAEDNVVTGFAGLVEGEIAGLFVRRGARSRGVGGELIRAVQSLGLPLRLCVYEKNTAACRFYLRQGFVFRHRQIDPATGEAELVLTWAPPI